jgi:hypothetical protein
LITEKGVYLGNYAKSSATFKNNDLVASVLVADSVENKTSKWDADAELSMRYALQFQARKAMLEYFYSHPEENLKKAHKVCNCRRDLRPVQIDEVAGKKVFEMSKPKVFRHNETGKTFFGGLVVCGSGYACPIDAPKIAEMRAAEIREAVTEWVKSGGVCLFVTLTFPHYRTDSLKSSLVALKTALQYLRYGRSYKKKLASLGYVGLIRSIEVTWGEDNGWHPHCHEIWFVRPDFVKETKAMMDSSGLYKNSDLSVASLTALCDSCLKPDLFPLWESACIRAGLSAPSYERGMVIKACETEEQLLERLADYLVKTGLEKPPWGVDDELTKLHSKRGKPGRFTPFDFLRKQYDVECTKGEKYRFRCLFAEFVTAFKGTAKPFWSKGLKARFEIKEFTDEQIAEQKTEKAVEEYEVPRPLWVCVIGFKDHRATFLLKLQNEGVQAAKAYIESLLDLYFGEDLELYTRAYDSLSSNLQYILDNYDD